MTEIFKKPVSHQLPRENSKSQWC